MNKFFYTLMGALLAATCATATFTTEAPALARKTGGSPARLQEKQQQRHKAATQNRPDMRMARKVGGYKSSLLHRQHMRYLHNGQV